MTLHDYLRVVGRRWWILVAAAALATAGAVGYSLHQHKLYSASSVVLLNSQNLGAELANVSLPNADPARVAQTQAGVARVPTVAVHALEAVHLRRRTPAQFLTQSSVSASTSTDLLTFSVTDRNRRLASALATSYARAYVGYRHDLDTLAISRANADVKRQLARLQASGDTHSALYATLLEKSQQLTTMQTLQTSNASVIRTAGAASQTQPRTIRNAAFGLALGLLLGLGLIFLVESLDTRVRSADEQAEELRLPLLARLPEPPRRLRKKHRLVMVETPQSRIAEAFRVFATNIEFANLNHHAHTFLFTSAAEDEGKSTTVANLAVAFALAGRRVVLVDLDLRNPQQHRFFALREQPGLTEIALDRCELTDALAAVPLFSDGNAPAEADVFDGSRTLEVLPCGALPPSAGEFVRSQALADILDELHDRAEFVFIDSPPALGAGDAIALSARVDAVIVVSNLDKARRPMLDELHRTLLACPAPVLGLAVTGAELEYRYSYGPYSGSARSFDQQVTP